MRNGKFRKKLSIFAVSIALLFGGVFGGQNLNDFGNNAKAITMTDTTSYVKVGELYDVENQAFDSANFSILKKYISGNVDATISDIDTMATSISDASIMRAKTLDAGTLNDIEYTAKTSSQDIVVRLGGLDWQVMYLSKDKNGNSILTLWLSNSTQEAWADRSATEGEYYGFLNGGLYSDWACNWYSNITSPYPCAMYGTSYINAVTLNNGGQYATDVSTLSAEVEKDANSVFATFTMEEFGLTDYLVTPRYVSWQENQSARTSISLSSNLPNEAWSKDTADDKNTGNYSWALRKVATNHRHVENLIKEKDLWEDVKDLYLNNKNKEPNKKSRIVYYQTLETIYRRNFQ